MNRLCPTLLVAGLATMGLAPQAHAQFFNYSTDFETPNGLHVVNAFSTDTQAFLGINDINSNPVDVSTGSLPVPLYQFATSANPTTQPNPGVFNFSYKVKVTLTPANSAGVALAGYSPVTQFITGTITGQLTQTSNSLVNTYDNLVSTPDGQAEVANYVFAGSGVPTTTYQLRALPAQFNNGGSPVPKLGSASATLVATPEPGSLAMFVGMSLTGMAFLRRKRSHR